jgi:hypothetical protein
VILLKKLLTLIFYFNLLFFFFDIKDLNSIDDIALIYDNDSLYDEKYYNISFYDFYLSELEESIKDLDIKIISITPEDYEKLEFISVDKVIEEVKNSLINDNKDEEAINVYQNNFRIKSMVVISTKENIIELEKRIKII